MEKKGSKTMLWSVAMSAPGPLVLGIGLMTGKSNTQLADFVRRSIELLAIVASFVAYQITAHRQLNPQQTARLERNTNLFVGVTMLIAGAIMLGITLLANSQDKGNVGFGLVIALLGAAANTFFWLRYRRLARAEESGILEVQARLYRAKSLVDLCVSAALLAVLAAPGSPAAAWLDLVGSAVVSVYLGYSGLKIVLEKLGQKLV